MVDSNFPLSAPTTSTPPLSPLTKTNAKKKSQKHLVVIDTDYLQHS
jgi:hypothetical protein